MKMIFKQRFFSWFDSYDIYSEDGNVIYTVKGQLAWGHRFKIYNSSGDEVGEVRERVLTWLPKFEIYVGGCYTGCIKKQFTFFAPKFDIDYNGWSVDGDFFEWDYSIMADDGRRVATISKQLLNFTDTYVIDVNYPCDCLNALVLALAIDAEKCSR